MITHKIRIELSNSAAVEKSSEAHCRRIAEGMSLQVKLFFAASESRWKEECLYSRLTATKFKCNIQFMLVIE